MLNFIDGGVCAAQGFRAAGVHAGVKTHAEWKKDVALIVSDVDCAAAAMFTKNVVKAAPIHVDLLHLADGKARAIIANSGNANACAPQGEENAERMCAAAARAIGCRPEDVLASSTGVIGQRINVEAIEKAVPALCAALERSAEASDAAGHAIMTTDTVKKEAAVETTVGGKTVRMGGVAKGSGMIHPNMGTMLCFLTTDCAISPEMIKTALLETVSVSFNRISVDGDTSTNEPAASWPTAWRETSPLRPRARTTTPSWRPCGPCARSLPRKWPPTAKEHGISSPAPSKAQNPKKVPRPSPSP